MEHNWENYFDTTSECWTKLQALYAANEHFPKKVVKGRNLHHKFLRSFSKAEGTEVDNDDDSLVSLGLGDHFLAHWLLWKCSKTSWKRYTSRACHFMFKKSIKHLTFEAAAIIAGEWNDIVADYTHSEETKRKIRENMKGKYIGENNPMFGKPSPMKGKHLSEEAKQKLREANKGKSHPHSEETKRKIAEANKGKPSPNKGKHWKLVNGKRIYY